MLKFESAVVRLLNKLLPKSWSLQKQIQITRLSGALTNAVYKVSNRKTSVLLRIYGTGSDAFIQRSKELEWFLKMSEVGLGPRLLGLFGNGRIEEFLDAHTLTAHDLRQPDTSQAISRSMVHLHRISKLFDQEQLRPELWDRLKSWYHLALEAHVHLKSTRPAEAARIDETIDLSSLWIQIEAIQESLSQTGTIVFAHNDLQYGNILRLQTSGEIILVDYEYAGFSYREFDIANLFCEWDAGSFFYSHLNAQDYHSEEPHLLDFENRYPSRQEQLDFLSPHVDLLIELGDLVPFKDALSRTFFLEQLCDSISQFTLCSHLLWGFWGIFRGAAVESMDFDYISYGLQRLSRFASVRKV